MIIRNTICPGCNCPSSITIQDTVEHVLKGGKVRCDCKFEYWVFTPSDMLCLEAWGIAPEIRYDFVAVPAN